MKKRKEKAARRGSKCCANRSSFGGTSGVRKAKAFRVLVGQFGAHFQVAVGRLGAVGGLGAVAAIVHGVFLGKDDAVGLGMNIGRLVLVRCRNKRKYWFMAG